MCIFLCSGFLLSIYFHTIKTKKERKKERTNWSILSSLSLLYHQIIYNLLLQVPLEHSFILLLTLYPRQTQTQRPKRHRKASIGTTTATVRNRKITHWQEKLILINHTLANTNHSANRGFILSLFHRGLYLFFIVIIIIINLLDF